MEENELHFLEAIFRRKRTHSSTFLKKKEDITKEDKCTIRSYI